MNKLAIALLSLSFSFSNAYANNDVRSLSVESVVCNYELAYCAVVGQAADSQVNPVALIFDADSFIASEFGEYFEASSSELETLLGEGRFRAEEDHLSAEAKLLAETLSGTSVEAGYDFRYSPHEDIGYYFMSEIRFGNESSF